MADFLSQVSQVVSAVVIWIGQYLDVIMDNPALLFVCICIPVVSATIDMFRRLLRL